MNNFPIRNLVLGVLGGIAGGIVGGFICKFLYDQGFYGGAVPGALVGVGFALAARKGQMLFGVVSGILGLLAGLISEWQLFHSQQSFISSIAEIKGEGPMTWIMLGIGTLLAFSFGKGSFYRSGKHKPDFDDHS